MYTYLVIDNKTGEILKAFMSRYEAEKFAEDTEYGILTIMIPMEFLKC